MNYSEVVLIASEVKMVNFRSPNSMSVLICSPSMEIRKSILKALRDIGFENFVEKSSPDDIVAYLESESVDWVITSVFASEATTALHLLKLISSTKELQGIRVSLLVSESDEVKIPLAFELGCFSYHDGTRPLAIGSELKGLIQKLKSYHWDDTLTSAAYLKKYLKKQRIYPAMERLDRGLLSLYPGSGELLLQLAETQLLDGRFDEGRLVVQQVGLLGEQFQKKGQQLMASMAPDESLFADDLTEPTNESEDNSSLNPFSVDTCVIVDPDTQVLYGLEQQLNQVGIPNVLTFQSGQEAWTWIEDGGRPDLIIQEWRLPDVTGPQFIQRIRQKNLVTVPVVIISSLISSEDYSLVEDMGVACILEKPFEMEMFFSQIIAILQQDRLPTELLSYERKIRSNLRVGNLDEAKRLYSQYLHHPQFTEESATPLKAEFAYAEADYSGSAQLALEALKYAPDNVWSLDLLGKCFIKLGNFDKALEAFDKAKKLSPKNVERLCNLATIQNELNNLEEAEENLQDAKNQDPDCPIVRETEAKMALAQGDAERASSAMAQMDSLTKILAFTNNKAVALTRCGQLEAGIQLYQETLQALPGSWSYYHEIVTYNLGLAFARYSEPTRAKTELVKLAESKNTPLRQKADSLLKRVEKAITKGLSQVEGMHQGATAKEETIVVKTKGSAWTMSINSKGNDKPPFTIDLSQIDLKRGDMCCFKIFFAKELADPVDLLKLKNPIQFVLQKVLEDKAGANAA